MHLRSLRQPANKVRVEIKLSLLLVFLFLHFADAAAHAAASLAHLASSPDPPSYAASFSSPEVKIEATPSSNASHPRVAVLLGVNARWHIPLLICRALSTAPAAWWGLRCAFTFLRELLRSDGTAVLGGDWTVEKRFRVTEVFLAILWVGRESSRDFGASFANRAYTHSALRPLTYHTSLRTA